MANLNAGKGSQRMERAVPKNGDERPVTQPLAEAVAECGEVYSKGFAQWQDEVARFTQTRLQKNSELADAMARCRDVNDIFGLQQEWMRTASQDYLEQAARLMGVASRMTQDWMQPMTRLWGNGAVSALDPRPKV